MTESGIPENWEGPRSFGRRMGRKLSPARLALIERLMPELGVELKDVPDASLDPTSLFSNSISTVWLEIGFGKGEHLLAQAKANPDVGFIGCEPFVNGVASALVEIEQQGLENIRIYPDDARTVLKALAPQSVERVFLLHPDPWPKTRHADRRFANPQNLAQIARVLDPEGEFRVSTDHPTYSAWLFQELHRSGVFNWCAEQRADWALRPEDWPETRYGEKALAGCPIYLRFTLKDHTY